MAENEMNLFDQLPEAQPAVGTGTVEKSADAKKRELLKHAMEQTLKTNGAAYTHKQPINHSFSKKFCKVYV